MKTFTTVTKQKKESDKNTLFQGDYIKIEKIQDWECLTGNDCVVMLPHLIDLDEILLRKEWIPSYNKVNGNLEHLTAVSGTMNKGETEIQTLVRELEEETGIKLRPNYKSYNKIGEFFMFKGSTIKCHLYYLPLYNYQYDLVEAKGDGSVAEEKSQTVKIDIKYIDYLEVSDLATSTLINLFKLRMIQL